MDTDNPVVRLCVAGIEAEVTGPPGAAGALYEQAWATATDDYEACIAAHYLARHTGSVAEELAWNEIALDRALAVPDDRAAEFLPSLYLNLGSSLERSGERAEARRAYQAAEAALPGLPEGGYADLVQRGVAAGLARVGAQSRST